MRAEPRSYKRIVIDRIESGPTKGRGEYSKIAERLKVNNSMVSQIFRGDKDLTMEQAATLVDYLGFNDIEAEHFIQLVAIERAGSVSLKRRLQKRLTEIEAKMRQVDAHISPAVELDDNAKALFYSHWYFSAIRLASDIPGLGNVDAMAKHLNLPRATTRRVVQFLLSTGLCVGNEDDFRIGPPRTHVSANSPVVARHHTNWRLKSIHAMEAQSPTDLFFSSPMTLSEEDVEKVRLLLMNVIEKTGSVVDRSPSQKLRCLTIDWYAV